MSSEKPVTDARSLKEFLLEYQSDAGNCYKVHIEVDQGCEQVLKDDGFQLIIRELFNNCAEKPMENIEIGVLLKKDTIEGKQGFRLVVEDSVRYAPKEARGLVKKLNKKKVQSGAKTKDAVTGGIGLIQIRRQLASWGGSLQFEASDDNRVIAIAQWSEYGFLYPKPIPQGKTMRGI